jgi:hypothetical protein
VEPEVGVSYRRRKSGQSVICIAFVGYFELGLLLQIMLDAHVNSMTLLATPFKPETPQPFSFGQGTQSADITHKIRAQIPVMLNHRLTPPPRETYSLNRYVLTMFTLSRSLNKY